MVDVREVLDGSGEQGCWCQAWRGLDTKAISGGEPRTQLLREQMRGGPPAPGFLAYLEGVPVGWVGVAVRTETPRLVNSRTIPALDDLPVWSIGCFRIRAGYRRRGIARALLDGVVDAARRAGAPGVEAYPIDPRDAAWRSVPDSWASPPCSTPPGSAVRWSPTGTAAGSPASLFAWISQLAPGVSEGRTSSRFVAARGRLTRGAGLSATERPSRAGPSRFTRNTGESRQSSGSFALRPVGRIIAPRVKDYGNGPMPRSGTDVPVHLEQV